MAPDHLGRGEKKHHHSISLSLSLYISEGFKLNFHRYIFRNEQELVSLKADRRRGRPPSKREDQIEHQIDTETKEFKSGFWIPDVRQKQDLLKLQQWSGDWSSLNTLLFARVDSERNNFRPSTFPPKGLS